MQVSQPLFKKLTVAGHDIFFFEVDYGSALSLISCFVYRKFLRRYKLLPCNLQLVTANGEALTIMGRIITAAKSENACVELELIVTDKRLRRCLLGRDGLSKFNPTWRSLRNHS